MAHRLTILMAMLMASMPCRAQDVLSDPTRPPTAQSASGDAGDVSGPVLQSVVFGKGRRAVAVISGQRVELGAQYGDAVLTRVTETEVVLQGAGGRQVLKMTPEAAKRPLQKPRKSRRGSSSAASKEATP